MARLTDAAGCRPANLPALQATLWISEKGCAVCINPTPAPLKFSWIGRKLFASDQRQVILPADDDTTREALVDRLMASMKRDPESVFVCEVAPWGPFAEHPTSALQAGTSLLADGFTRLKKFFSANTSVTTIAPPKSVQPVNNAEDFIHRIATSSKNWTVAALLAAQMASAFAGPLQQPVEIEPAAAKPVAMQMAQQQSAAEFFKLTDQADGTSLSLISADMAAIAADYVKYAGHGRSDVETVLSGVLSSQDGNNIGAASFNTIEKKCHISELRTDYSEIVEYLSLSTKWADPALRPVLVAHEDMHCRMAPFMAKTGYKHVEKQSADAPAPGITGEELAGHHTAHANESMADAMSILIVARRDGVPEATVKLGKMDEIRRTGDRDHDTRTTLNEIGNILKNHPEKFSSDAVAFQTAVEVGMTGSIKHMIANASESETALMRTEGFIAAVTKNVTGISQAMAQYGTGKYAKADAQLWMYGHSQDVQTKVPAAADSQRDQIDTVSVASVAKQVDSAYQALTAAPAPLVRQASPAPAACPVTTSVGKLALPMLGSDGMMSRPGMAMKMLRQQARQAIPDMTDDEEEASAPRV